MLFGNKKEWHAKTYYNISELWEHYTKWKKPFTKDHILYDFIYMKCPEYSKLEIETGWMVA